MKVLQITAGVQGGAGIAALRLAEELRNNELEVRILSGGEIESSSSLRFWVKRILGKFLTLYQRSITSKDYDLVTTFSIGQIPLVDIYKFAPDIIHIHNWYNLLSVKDLGILGKDFPLVFTLHDERLLTGGCHITLGCEKFISGCKNCPAVKINQRMVTKGKLEIEDTLKGMRNYGVITPSSWLLNKFLLTLSAANCKATRVIPNVTITSYNLPLAKSDLDGKENFKFLFVAADLSARVKDFRLAFTALELFEKRYGKTFKISLHVVGKNFPKNMLRSNSFQIETYDYLSEEKLAILMAECDALVMTSSSENSPNVIAESQFRGLVVIANSVGGVPELVSEQITGFLFDSTAESLVDAILRFCKSNRKDKIVSNAYGFASAHWNSSDIVASHLDLYSEILDRK